MATYLFYLRDDIVHSFDTKDLTSDCAILVGGRWGGRVSNISVPSGDYVFFATTGFAPSVGTCIKALGDLGIYFGVVRGNPDASAESLVKYLECRRRWNVPEDLSSTGSDGTSGPGPDSKSAQTFNPGKRWKQS